MAESQPAHEEHTRRQGKGAILGHPIHPILVAFPIAFVTSALAVDLAFALTSDAFWARLGLWIVGAALILGAFAAIFGILDFFTVPLAREHRAGWIHFIGNAVVLILTLINFLIRWDGVEAAVLPWGLTLSAVSAILLGITGWYGGELVYQHKIGIACEE